MKSHPLHLHTFTPAQRSVQALSEVERSLIVTFRELNFNTQELVMNIAVQMSEIDVHRVTPKGDKS